MNIKELAEEYLRYLKPFYNAFKDYYGEDRVDLVLPLKPSELYEMYSTLSHNEYYNTVNFVTTPYIIIHFPHVRVSNENGVSTKLQNVYIKLNVSPIGMVSKMTLLTTSLTKGQLKAGYMHSHAQRIPRDSNGVFRFTWRSCCLGNGPLARMINSRVNINNISTSEKAYIYYQALAYEIDRWTQVESLHGGPYVGIAETFSDTNSNNRISPSVKFPTNLAKEIFLKFLDKVEADDKLRCKYPILDTGYTPVEMHSILSNIIKETADEETMFFLIRSRLMILGRYEDTIFKEYDGDLNEGGINILSEPLFKFKGKDVYLEVTDTYTVDIKSYTYLLHPDVYNSFRSKLITLLNFSVYGNKHRNANANQSSELSGESGITANQ
jgi:hypothetical protein